VLGGGWAGARKRLGGGLEAPRRYFFSLPDWQTYPPEFIQKLSSDRIYATLFYPNALAGVLLLLVPVAFVVLWGNGGARTPAAQRVAAGGLLVLAVGCLYWSGSKAGWLIALGEGFAALLTSRIPRSTKVWILGIALASGLAGFGLRYHSYFARGATSASARVDYWRAAVRTLASKPLFGSGPGTFAVTYRTLKSPDAEMARLAHNDYLQQGSDSGCPGMLLYSLWLLGGLGWVARSRRLHDRVRLAVYIGLCGIAAQGFVEFWLYIPAIAWTAFLLLGWLVGQTRTLDPQVGGNQIDKTRAIP